MHRTLEQIRPFGDWMLSCVHRREAVSYVHGDLESLSSFVEGLRLEARYCTAVDATALH